jgi:DNA-binding CsgD family transcriptional regulator
MSAKHAHFDQEARAKIIDYMVEVDCLRTPDEVLNRLNDITSERNPIHVHGANRFSVKADDWRRFDLGKNVFIHRDVSRGWLGEWAAFVASGSPTIGATIARTCLAPFTWTELSRMFDPIGIDRWPFDLALKYRMRDGYVCPVGGRWAVGFWSPGVLGNGFTQQDRGLLHMVANAAAVRLESLVTDDAKRVGSRACLTPREQSVLRHASVGLTLQETATALGLAEETVRSHFKKAQAKLGTRNRMHTLAQAMRDLLII